MKRTKVQKKVTAFVRLDLFTEALHKGSYLEDLRKRRIQYVEK